MNREVIELQQNVWGKSVYQHYEDALVLKEVGLRTVRRLLQWSRYEMMGVWTRMVEVEIEKILEDFTYRGNDEI